MLLKTRLVKTAIVNASSEKGAFSDGYNEHSSDILMNEGDMRQLNLHDKDSVRCLVPEKQASSIFIARENKHVLTGTVHVMETPRTRWTLEGLKENQDVDVEKSDEKPDKIRVIFEKMIRALN
nr:hypothetical protein [Candidatus Sigynarchaeota archaeon]